MRRPSVAERELTSKCYSSLTIWYLLQSTCIVNQTKCYSICCFFLHDWWTSTATWIIWLDLDKRTFTSCAGLFIVLSVEGVFELQWTLLRSTCRVRPKAQVHLHDDTCIWKNIEEAWRLSMSNVVSIWPGDNLQDVYVYPSSSHGFNMQ